MKNFLLSLVTLAIALTSVQASPVMSNAINYVVKASDGNDDDKKADAKKAGQNVTTGLTRQSSTIYLMTSSVVALWNDPIIAPAVYCTENYDGALIYESSDESVVLVNPETGALTPKGPGTATITISGEETERFYAPAAVSYTVTINMRKADLNNDGKVDVADLMTIIGIITSKTTHDTDPSGNIQEAVEAVDLGLPSGTLWANMNIGATKPEGYGLFFAWGDINGYTSNTADGQPFDLSSYKWMEEGQESDMYYNKYQIDDGYTDCCWYNSESQFIGDGKTVLDPEDDAAAVLWGDGWRMPTIDDVVELLGYTKRELTIVNDVYGCKLTSILNGKSIFLPSAGERYDCAYIGEGKECAYWSASISPNSSRDATHFVLGPKFYFPTWGFSLRYIGKPIRPVKQQ